MNSKLCVHCRGAQYVPIYWFEKMLDQNGIHMTEIPSRIFERIPVECLCYCHCNLLMPRLSENQIFRCLECKGTTWCFTEIAEQGGYQWKKVYQLSLDEIKSLPCEYFERCHCGYDEQSFKRPQKKKVFEEVLELLKSAIPNFGFSTS